jgi:RNA polymerase sigma-54 factor
MAHGIELNSDTLPKVLINQRYYAQVSDTTRNQKKKPISRIACKRRLGWCVHSISEQRRFEGVE